MALDDASLPYHEPEIVTVLIYSSFLLLLNIVNYILDKIVFCGLIGQIFLGVAWGAPGAKWLPLEAQDTAVSLGYIGLILLVYEGGICTNLQTLKANLSLSVLVAIVGIGAPIGLSFVLQALLHITPLQAFAAGAALCSTSLGTTFTVLSTSGLTESRLGVVLTSAAMLDDVVGLVMVQVISNLGSSSFSATTVIRPVAVSVAFAFVIPCTCCFVVKPLAERFFDETSHMPVALRTPPVAFMIHTSILLAFVTSASVAGTSNLFAAYLAGACITWFDNLELESRKDTSSKPACEHSSSETPTPERKTHESSTKEQVKPSRPNGNAAPKNTRVSATTDAINGRGKYQGCSGHDTFNAYYLTTLSTILKPLFFASIGFSIPISRMFSGHVVLRGFVFACLMAFGKLLCGLCLIRFSMPSLGILSRWTRIRSTLKGLTSKEKKAALAEASQPTAGIQELLNELPKPLSLHPAAILGSAMVARGEIGFLISAVAESNGIFAASPAGGGSDLFLVVTWAILLCTVAGPIAVGLLVKRVRRLQATEREWNLGKVDPLGIWGIVENAL